MWRRYNITEDEQKREGSRRLNSTALYLLRPGKW
jgi:hypothetical protein